MYAAFTALDCSIVEINPLVVTGAGDVVALDAKVSFDDNALFRHPELEKLRDEAEEDPKELEAAKYNLNYVALDGNIGCMVNGAGLAMATMDIIKLYGAAPANFLDVGGGATKERVTAAFKIILSDPNVEGILVNIFGGIMRCDVIAEGVVSAAREVQLVGAAGGAAGRHQRASSARRSWRSPTCRSSPPTTWPTRRRRSSTPCRRPPDMAILVDANTTRHHAGLHRRAGHVPFRAGDRLRHQGRSAASRRARAARTHLDLPVFDTVAEAREKTGADRDRDLRAAAVRRRRDPGGDRCRDPADRLHHRGHSGARHGAGEARAERFEVAADRAELPRRDHAGRLQDRHHARPHPSARQRRHRVALRHADL